MPTMSSSTWHSRALAVVALALPPTAAAGPLFGVGQAQLFRVLLGVTLLLAVVPVPRSKRRLPAAFLALAALVLVSAGITRLWPGWDDGGLVELASLVAGLLLAAALARAGTWRWLALGVVLTVLGQAVVVIWEVTSGLHLPTFALTWEDDRFMGMWFQMAGTFANPNQLGHLLVVAFPVTVAVVATERSWWLRGPALLAALLCPWLVHETGSRISLLVLLVEISAVLLLVRHGWMVLAAAAAAGAATLLLHPGVLTALLPVDEGEISTDDPRLNLAVNGGWMLLRTWGLGVGPGQYGAWTLLPESPREPFGLTNPHNAVVEIASQYGIVVAAALLTVVVVVLWWARQAWRRGERTQRFTPLAVFLVLGLWPVIGMTNSTWMPLSWSVLELGLLGAVAARLAQDRGGVPASD